MTTQLWFAQTLDGRWVECGTAIWESPDRGPKILSADAPRDLVGMTLTEASEQYLPNRGGVKYGAPFCYGRAVWEEEAK